MRISRITKVPQLLRRASCYHFALVGTISATCGCEEPTEKEVRTEPWKNDTRSSDAEKVRSVPFRPSPDQFLRFEVRGRKGRPEGRIGGVDGAIEVAFSDLSQTQGRLTFDLRTLTIENEQEPGTPSWSKEARRWLGLGESVPPSQQHPQAEFEIHGLTDLSRLRPWEGPIRKREDGKKGQVRKLYGKAVGELELRGLSVERQLSIWLNFYYGQSASADVLPEKIVISLRGPTTVPLSEYEILPRDEHGHLISDQLSLIGQEVGRAATISGDLEFVHGQAAGKGDNVPP